MMDSNGRDLGVLILSLQTSPWYSRWEGAATGAAGREVPNTNSCNSCRGSPCPELPCVERCWAGVGILKSPWLSAAVLDESIPCSGIRWSIRVDGTRPPEVID